MLGNIYKCISAFFDSRNHEHSQHSLYQHPAITPFAAWHDMLDLRSIAPAGVIPSILNKLQMFHIDVAAMVVTDDMRLGGQYSPYAFGPMPAGLFPQNLNHVQLGAPPNPWPVGVAHSAMSHNPSNWAI